MEQAKKIGFDSGVETEHHIGKVRDYIYEVVQHLNTRSLTHDQSKLKPPEKEILDEWTPKLRGITYGSDQYRDMMKQMKPMIEHHHQNNPHHPEFYEGGIHDMDLIDIVEMLCDWKAATLRHDDGDIRQSVAINMERHGIDKQLADIFYNTINRLGW